MKEAKIIWIDVKQRMVQDTDSISLFEQKEKYIESKPKSCFNRKRPKTANAISLNTAVNLNRAGILTSFTSHASDYPNDFSSEKPKIELSEYTRCSTISLPDENLKKSLLVVRGHGFKRQSVKHLRTNSKQRRIDFKNLSIRRKTLASLSVARVRSESNSQYPILLVSTFPSKTQLRAQPLHKYKKTEYHINKKEIGNMSITKIKL